MFEREPGRERTGGRLFVSTGLSVKTGRRASAHECNGGTMRHNKRTPKGPEGTLLAADDHFPSR